MPRRNHTRRPAKAGAPKKHTQKKRLTGVVELTRKGTGYMPWPLDAARGKPMKDIEIFPEKLGGALNGDTVEVELLTLFPRPRGRVAKVVSRAKMQFVGVMQGGKVKPDDVRFPGEITAGASAAKAAEGDKVLVELASFDGASAKGEILEVIGRRGEHRTEMNAIVLEHGFALNFPAAAQEEARETERSHAKVIAQEAERRADYRGVPTMTIDPADAKDFDDALSVRELPGGEVEVGVHIADATFFVREGSAIDAEMQRRGTSVYLVDATIPMLPHELSTNVCSLRSGEDRLAFSAVFTLTRDGSVRSRRFEKSIIRSDKRFTYEEAQTTLDQMDIVSPSHDGLTMSIMYGRELQVLRDLARVLRAKREAQGAIDFGENEVRFELDDAGKPLAVHRKERIETNLLIEEFMLLANREVARYIAELAKKVPEKNYVFLYRIHDTPKEDRIEELATFVRAVGYDFEKKKRHYSAKDIQQLLEQIAGKPEAALIRTATLRSMAKAIYSTKNIGHFGLAFEYYTHFTSPIRRYPDMLVHRILYSHLSGKPMTRKEYGHLEKLCLDASLREAEAVAAERESVKYKLVEYMQGKIGQTFEGVISGVTDWGIYVEEKESSAEGLVRVATLGGDYFNYSQKEYALVGQRTKKKYALGDEVRVRLVGADLSSRQLDFELV